MKLRILIQKIFFHQNNTVEFLLDLKFYETLITKNLLIIKLKTIKCVNSTV